jgi:hypothetical protein
VQDPGVPERREVLASSVAAMTGTALPMTSSTCSRSRYGVPTTMPSTRSERKVSSARCASSRLPCASGPCASWVVSSDCPAARAALLRPVRMPLLPKFRGPMARYPIVSVLLRRRLRGRWFLR